MSQPADSAHDALNTYIAVVEATIWPVALLTPDGHVLAASEPARALLHLRSHLRQPLERSVVAADHAELRQALRALTLSGQTTLARVHIGEHDPQLIEIELLPALDCDPPLISAVFYPQSLAHRRQQLILGCNLLAPHLLNAASAAAVYRQVAETLRGLGFGMLVMELTADGAALHPVYDGTNTSVHSAMDSGGHSLQRAVFPIDAPLIAEVVIDRRAIYHRDAAELNRSLYPPETAELLLAVQRITGLHGYIFAPLNVEGDLRGLLVVLGQLLDEADVPFIEAFGHQIGGALAQIELRQAMERQIQRLTSLATTAHAVTSLGNLQDVLEVICHQSRALLNAEMTMLALLTPDGSELEIRNSAGEHASRIGARLPVDASMVGRVLRGGIGVCLADIREDPQARPNIRPDDPSRAALVQPLLHRGVAMGVLIVGHTQPGYFGSIDLDYLGRYAEYATLAIVNAQLYRDADEARRYLDTIIQNAPDAMLVIRPDMTLQPLNTSLTRSFGYDPDGLAGRPFMQYVPDDQLELAKRYWEAATRGEAQRFEMDLLRPGGRRYTAQISINKIPGYDEILVTVRDTTELRKLESELRRGEKLAALGRMVAGAAHELNNPLAVILGLAQLQLQEQLAPATRRDMEAIEVASLRAAAIIQQLRLFARPQLLRPQPVDMRETAEEALSRLGSGPASAGVQIVRRYADEPLLAAGDPNQLAQVLLNVLQNALQAVSANPPGAPRTITISGWRDPERIWLSIGDDGPGIQTEHLQHLFEPFFTTREVGQGLGLGLALVHALVQQHGGAVRVESEPGRGALFSIELPATPGQRPAAGQRPALPPATRILLVEDQEYVRAVTERTLTSHGCAVDAVDSGEQALAHALRAQYALVISDIQMPGMDGPALYAQLSALQPQLRWLILTGDTMGERSRRFLDRTRLPALPKPFTQERLISSVAECLVA